MPLTTDPGKLGLTRKPTRAQLKLIGQWLLVALVLFFLGRILARHWGELKAINWQVDVPLLAFSYCLLGLAWLCLVANWRWLMKHMGAPLRLHTAWRIWFLSNIVRYIPGNVWQFVGMVYLCEKEGITRTRTLASILVYQTVSVASGLLAAGAVYLLDAGIDSPSGGAASSIRHGSESGGLAASTLSWANLGLIAGASLVALVVCMPPVMNWGLRHVFRLLHRETVQIELGFSDLARFFLQRLGIWGLQGLAFAAFVRSVYATPLAAFPVLGAAYALSWVLGFVSLLTPSGLGVREAVQTALLASMIPLSISVALALLSRLWLILGELAGAALGIAIGRLEARKSAQEKPGV